MTEYVERLETRLSIIEGRVSFIEGKDIRDYEKLNKIEITLEEISRKVDAINNWASARNKIFAIIFAILTLFATVIGGSDVILRHMGLS